jgi:hypothetical protein
MDLKITITNKKLVRDNQEIIAITISGVWERGIEGQYNSKYVIDILLDLLEAGHEYKIIFDYSELAYEYGDSIIKFIIELMKNKIHFTYCIIANSKTAKAIEPLMEWTAAKINYLGMYSNIDQGIKVLVNK